MSLSFTSVGIHCHVNLHRPTLNSSWVDNIGSHTNLEVSLEPRTGWEASERESVTILTSFG